MVESLQWLIKKSIRIVENGMDRVYPRDFSTGSGCSTSDKTLDEFCWQSYNKGERERASTMIQCSSLLLKLDKNYLCNHLYKNIDGITVSHESISFFQPGVQWVVCGQCKPICDRRERLTAGQSASQDSQGWRHLWPGCEGAWQRVSGKSRLFL